MRLITTMLALMLCSSGAWAEWVKVHENGAAEFYIDIASIRKDGNLRTAWSLYDTKVKQNDYSMSMKLKMEYDCRKEMARTLFISLHSDRMGNGFVRDEASTPYSNDWKYIAPLSTDDYYLKIVCRK